MNKYDYRCNQCGRKMNPIDYFIGSICLQCCQKNQHKLTGSTKNTKNKKGVYHVK